MFAVSETELQRCVLSLVIYLLLCCLVSGVKNDQTSQTNDEATSNNQQTMGSHYCHGPPEPLVVVKAFVPVGVRTAHSENIYNTTRPKAPFSPNTTVILDCQLANGVTYTLVHSGSKRFTCVQPDGTVDATWDKPFPKCERNVCWWLGDETNLQFFYKGRMLNNATQQGFPEGTELHFLNWECKAGEHAHVNPLTCSTLGEWNGIYPACVADTTPALSTTKTLGEMMANSAAISNLQTIENIESSEDISIKHDDTAEDGYKYVIWACVMTVICGLMLAIGSLLIYCKFFRNRKGAKSNNLAKCPTVEALYQHVELQSTPVNEEFYYCSSKKCDNEYSEIEGAYNTVRDSENSSSPTYAEPVYAFDSSKQTAIPVYAVPIPKPRRIRPGSVKLEAKLPQDAEPSQEGLRLSLSFDKKIQIDNSSSDSSPYSENNAEV